MSTELMNAADAVKSVGRTFRAVITMADELEKIGSIDQAANEAQRRLDATVKAEVDATASLNTTRTLLASVQAELDAAQTSADALKADAVAKAQQAADAVLADANMKAAEIVAAAVQKADDVDATTAKAQEELDAINQAIADAQATHTDVTTKIDALKTSIGAV